jgi:hypothetical protein
MHAHRFLVSSVLRNASRIGLVASIDYVLRMIRRIVAVAMATMAAVALIRPADAQTDWRMTLGVLYSLSYVVSACGIKATPGELQQLERRINHAEGKVRMSRAELADIRRRGEVEARKDTRRMCDTMGREASRLLRELPDELPD